MCAYNVRRKKTLDHDPGSGASRAADFFRSLGIWALGGLALYLLYLLTSRYIL